jgi:molybdopterin molybdotransferase
MSSALLSYEQAAALVSTIASQLRTQRPKIEREHIQLAATAGRILAQPIRADRDQPPFSRSTRDGFACRAVEASTHEPLRIAGATRAGDPPGGPLPQGAAWEIMTGAPVPAGADSVIMIEHVEVAGSQVRLLPPRKVSAGENIVAQAAQAQKGDELIPAGTAITFAHIACAAECGYGAVDVFVRPRVAILTTGDELVPVESAPASGQIRNSNAPMLAALVTAAGGEPWVLDTASDNARALDQSLAEAAQADLLLISGGVSAGKFDLVEPALARAGAKFHFTGVRIQPGKPLVFAELPRNSHTQEAARAVPVSIPVFGLPGNPISSAVTFLLFASPVLAALAGSLQSAPRFALAQLAKETDRHSKPGLTRFLPALCHFNPPAGKLPQVALVAWHGSGDLSALASSNCFLVIPQDAHALQPGTIVQILLP